MLEVTRLPGMLQVLNVGQVEGGIFGRFGRRENVVGVGAQHTALPAVSGIIKVPVLEQS